jgi:hypothetical protein
MPSPTSNPTEREPEIYHVARLRVVLGGWQLAVVRVTRFGETLVPAQDLEHVYSSRKSMMRVAMRLRDTDIARFAAETTPVEEIILLPKA